MGGTDNRDGPFLERLAHHLQTAAIELRKFVEE